MSKAVVTIKTDGSRDYMVLPGGETRTLGGVSVLKLLTEAIVSRAGLRQALDEFIRSGEVVVSMDLDKAEKLFVPKRVRLATNSLFPPVVDAPPPSWRRGTMAEDKNMAEAISNQVAQIERQISTLNTQAKEAGAGSITAESIKTDIESLRALIAEIKSPSSYGDQSKNKTFYGLGPKNASEQPGAPEAPVAQGEPSLAVFEENSSMAEDILEKVAKANEQIDKLVKAGKKFASERAKFDLSKVAVKVASVLRDVDIAQPWVKNDLTALAKQADHIYGLFASAKV